MRSAIIGYSGAGKSTLARALGERYACPVLHLDALHFLPGWKERGDGDALSLLLPRLQEKSWVIDGNYGSLAYWERMELADQIIFFNFNRFQCLWQAYGRYRPTGGRSGAPWPQAVWKNLTWNFSCGSCGTADASASGTATARWPRPIPTNLQSAGAAGTSGS